MKRYFNIIGSSIIIILILTSIIFYTKQESITKTNLKENVIIEKLAQGAFINIQTEKISNKDMPQDNDIEDEYSIKGKRIEEADYLYDMHSLDFIEEQEAQRYFEDDFINSIKTSMQTDDWHNKYLAAIAELGFFDDTLITKEVTLLIDARISLNAVAERCEDNNLPYVDSNSTYKELTNMSKHNNTFDDVIKKFKLRLQHCRRCADFQHIGQQWLKFVLVIMISI